MIFFFYIVLLIFYHFFEFFLIFIFISNNFTYDDSKLLFVNYIKSSLNQESDFNKFTGFFI